MQGKGAVWGLRIKVQGLGFRVWGLGVRVLDEGLGLIGLKGLGNGSRVDLFPHCLRQQRTFLNHERRSRTPKAVHGCGGLHHSPDPLKDPKNGTPEQSASCPNVVLVSCCRGGPFFGFFRGGLGVGSCRCLVLNSGTLNHGLGIY